MLNDSKESNRIYMLSFFIQQLLGGEDMVMKELIYQFILLKKRQPAHANELLDFIQTNYLIGDLTIKEYKRLFYELDQRQAQKPIYYMDRYSFLIQPQAQ